MRKSLKVWLAGLATASVIVVFGLSTPAVWSGAVRQSSVEVDARVLDDTPLYYKLQVTWAGACACGGGGFCEVVVIYALKSAVDAIGVNPGSQARMRLEAPDPNDCTNCGDAICVPRPGASTPTTTNPDRDCIWTPIEEFYTCALCCAG